MDADEPREPDLDGAARPPLPDALDDRDDGVALERELRGALLADIDRMISRLQANLRAEPARAVRWLSLLQSYLHRQRTLVAELALDEDERIEERDDDDEDMGDHEGGFDPIGRNARNRRMAQAYRRRGGRQVIGGHQYADAQPDLNAAVRAQQIDALTRAMERAAPGGGAPNGEVYAAAERELQAVLRAVPPARGPGRARVVGVADAHADPDPGEEAIFVPAPPV